MADIETSTGEDWGSVSDSSTNPVRIAGPIYEKDVWIYRIVVGCLGFGIIFCLIGSVFLQYRDKEIPEILIAIGSASVGALAGLLSPNNRR